MAAAYGVIPPVRRHVGDPNLEAHCFGLKPGGISPVVQVANMHYIVKCEERHGVNAVEDLRGATMPWEDIVGNAGLFAAAVGVRAAEA